MNDKHIKTANLWNAAGVVVQTRWKHLIPVVYDDIIESEFGSGNDFSIPKGSLLNARQAGRSLRPTKNDSAEKERMRKRHDLRLPRKIRDRLWIILTKDIGIAKNEASKLCNLPEVDYRRVEDVISGMVDALWCADPNLFRFGSRSLSTVKKVARAIFKTGAYNRPYLVDMWKEWTNWLKHTCAKTDLIGGSEPPLGHANVFRSLNTIDKIAALIKKSAEVYTTSDLAMIGHLTSTRQMPYMGRKVEIASLREFEDVITSSPPTMFDMDEVVKAVKDVARRCTRSRGKTRIPEETAHCSTTCSGEITSPCKSGGQANAVSRDMKDYLLRKSEVEYTEETPWGPVHHLKGVELWKYLFREGYKFDYEFYKDEEFLGEWMKGGIPITVEGYFYGLDGVIGRQLLYVAWKMALNSGYPQNPPEIRCSTVPELGNKARIVTVSHWWLNYLEAPVAHWLIELLRFHPSCFSAFCRQDQAWSFQNLAKGLDPLWGSERRYSVLSSDLKNATNAIPLNLMRVMWNVFLTEMGYNPLERPYLNLVLGLISDRRVKFPRVEHYERNRLVSSIEEHTVVATRGLPMGEALAKPSLTLWALVAEQLAYNRCIALAKAQYRLVCDEAWKVTPDRKSTRSRRKTYPTRSLHPETLEVVECHSKQDISYLIDGWIAFGLPIDGELVKAFLHKESWRCFHLGGDDHVAIGPKSYLDLVTKSFMDLGAMLSPAKHGIGAWFIQYCERIVDVRRTNRIRVIDTMKVRLLETGTSTGIARDQRNIAIGKAAQFKKYIEWSGPEDGWSSWKKFQLQCMFISRMGRFMPKPGSPEFFGVFLPPEFGGFGLGMDSQIHRCLNLVPNYLREICYQIIRDPGNFDRNAKIISRLRSMVTNPTSRGIASVAKFEEEIKESINLYPKNFNARSWRELRSDPELQEEIQTPTGRKIDMDNKRFAARLEQKGILSASEYAKRCTRGNLFREMIMHPEKIKPFNTAHYSSSLRKLSKWWNDFSEKEAPYVGPVDERVSVRKTLDQQQSNWYVDSKEEIDFCTAARVKLPEDWGGGYDVANWDEITYMSGPRLLPQRESGRPDMVIGLVFAGLDKRTVYP